MNPISDIAVPESVFDSNSITIDLDPIEGLLSVCLNGAVRLKRLGFSNLGDGATLVFRALDKAEFRDFRVEELP
jgi:hypothetical protein